MSPAILRPFTPDDAAWVIDRHATLYAEHEGYDASFRHLVAQIVAQFITTRDTDSERGWIAWQGSLRCGSIFVVHEAPGVAKLRLVLIEPESRGTGLAQQMMDAALTFARARGYRVMRLWTHESHIAAGRLYARNGFSLVESTPNTAFGQAVIDQIWQRDL